MLQYNHIKDKLNVSSQVYDNAQAYLKSLIEDLRKEYSCQFDLITNVHGLAIIIVDSKGNFLDHVIDEETLVDTAYDRRWSDLEEDLYDDDKTITADDYSLNVDDIGDAFNVASEFLSEKIDPHTA